MHRSVVWCSSSAQVISSALSCLALVAAVLLLRSGELSAQTCVQDQATLAGLHTKLETDISLQRNACASPDSRQCQQWVILISIVNNEIAAATLQAHKACLPPSDISPDTPYGAPAGGGPATGGRIHTLALDPNSGNTILYAASTNAGVWKSTDSGHSWSQASVGIRNPFPNFPNNALGNQTLALDVANSSRLLFATQSDDGRVPQPVGGLSVAPYGGLYVSTNGAASWRHAERKAQSGTIGGLCPGNTGEIASVAFSSGQPFVAAPCGFFTNTDPGLADGMWTQLTTPFSSGTVVIAPNSYGGALFVCAGSQVFRSRNLGVNWDAPISPGAADQCTGLSVVPGSAGVPDTVAMMYSMPNVNWMPDNQQPQTVPDVSILSFGSAAPIDLGFNSVAEAGGSGEANVFVVLRGNAASRESGPGFAYDVYAADGFYYFVYAANKPWTNQTGGWKRLQNAGSGLHADSWSMAFPSTYDPEHLSCAAYVSNDGGIFMNSSSQLIIYRSNHTPYACDPSGGWVASMAGLHTLASYGMKGVTWPLCAPAVNCPTVYLATGDNDVWVANDGGATAGVLGDGLGDAGDVHLDPAFARFVVVTRGGCGGLAKLASAAVYPPGIAAQTFDVDPAPSDPTLLCQTIFSDGGLGPGNPFMTQVMALKSESPFAPLYFAVESPPNQTADVIVTSTLNPPNGSSWVGAEAASAAGFFDSTTHGRVARIQSTGGIGNPVLWVGTTLGQLYKGAVTGGKVSAWQSVSGAATTAVGNAGAFFVNPYNANYAWTVDLGDSKIKATTTGGMSWNPAPALLNIATNNGEFRVGCCTQFEHMFSWTCSLAWMSFDPNEPNVVVAALYPGGVAYSNNNGQSWALVAGESLDSTKAPAAQRNLLALPISVWYDDGADSLRRAIYVGLHGRGLMRIDGDFDALPMQ
jgi:hypothetical protein